MRQEETESDDRLMQRIGQGDRAAFAAFSDRHIDRTLALARRMLGNRSDAEDVVQDVFVQVWTRAAAWRPGGAKVSTWLYRVTVNRCLDLHRRPKGEDLDAAGEVADARPDPESSLGAREEQELVERAITMLPERQRAALALFYGAGLSQVEAAAALEVSEGALESLLARARRALREKLAPTVA